MEHPFRHPLNRLTGSIWLGLLLLGLVPKEIFFGGSPSLLGYMADFGILTLAAVVWIEPRRNLRDPLGAWIKAASLVLPIFILGEMCIRMIQAWPSPGASPPLSTLSLARLLIGGMIFLAAGRLFLALDRACRARAKSLRRLRQERARQSQAGFLPQYLLYEALGTVRDLAGLDPHRAAACLDDLTQFQCLALRWASLPDRPLWEEAELCRAFLRIEASRLGDQAVVVDWDLPGKVVDSRIPSGSLLALLVHALRHGVEGPGAWGEKIRISARRMLDSVVVTLDAPLEASHGGTDLHETIRKRLRSPADLFYRICEDRFKVTFRWGQESTSSRDVA